MRFFEIILLTIASIIPFYQLFSSSNYINKKILLGTIGGVLGIHLLIEGYRWQMFLTYFIIILTCWFIYKNYKLVNNKFFKKLITPIILLIVLIPAWILPIVLPVFTLPTPTGKYAIGSQYIHLKTNQDEIITPEINDKRELMIKVWYPAKIDTEKKERYLNNGDRISFAVKHGVPNAIFNYLDYVSTNTYSDASVADGKFPVLIFSHGSYSKASGYYALLEEIVSHGYIVLNINHTYESTGTLFPNGKIKYYNKAYDKKTNNQKMADMAWNSFQEYNKASNWDEEHLSIENTLRNYVAADITHRWSNDFSLVINALEKWNDSTFLSDHMDISKLGVFGHSQGGSAAGQSLIDDKRVKAGVNIDGVQWGIMIDTLMTKPFAIISSDWPDSHPDFNEHAYHNGSTTDFYNALILNSGHSNFMDIPLMISHLPALSESGSISPNKATEITSKIVVQFFDNYLMSESNDLLKLSNEYPELKMEMHNKSNTN